ncbi:MAG: hypothetical protein R3D51_17775 [Hyphomicrobiaceae bacterium]
MAGFGYALILDDLPQDPQGAIKGIEAADFGYNDLRLDPHQVDKDVAVQLLDAAHNDRTICESTRLLWSWVHIDIEAGWSGFNLEFQIESCRR